MKVFERFFSWIWGKVFGNAKEDIEFPLLWPKCECGCRETVGSLVSDKWEEHPGLKMTVIPLAQSVGITVPTLTIYSDYCVRCGRERNTMVEKKSLPVGMPQPGAPGTFQMPPRR